MNTHPFLTWPYLIFLVPGGLAVVLLLLSSVTSLGGDSDGDADTDADMDIDGDAETDADTDGESEGTTDHAVAMKYLWGKPQGLTRLAGAAPWSGTGSAG